MDPMENASRLRRKKKSILYRWLISYGIILTLTVALSGGIFLALENDLSQEIERTNQMRLSIVQKELDSRLELQKKLLMQVASSPELAELTRESGLTRARRASLVRKLTEQYLFFHESCPLFKVRGASDKDVMHDVLFAMDFEQWTAFMEEKHRGEFVLMEMQEKGSGSPQLPDVAYAYSYPMNPTAKPRATVLVVMSDGLLGEKLEALCTDGSSISVENEEGGDRILHRRNRWGRGPGGLRHLLRGDRLAVRHPHPEKSLLEKRLPGPDGVLSGSGGDAGRGDCHQRLDGPEKLLPHGQADQADRRPEPPENPGRRNRIRLPPEHPDQRPPGKEHQPGPGGAADGPAAEALPFPVRRGRAPRLFSQ